MEVENVFQYDRFDLTGDSVAVNYPGVMDPITLPPVAHYVNMENYWPFKRVTDSRYYDRDNPFPATRFYPDPRNLGQVTTNTLYPYDINTNDFIGKYNVAAYAWYDRRSQRGFASGAVKDRCKAVFTGETDDNMNLFYEFLTNPEYGNEYSNEKKACYSGLKQNRYYLSKQVDGKWLDFTHELQVNGCSFAIDYANAAAFTSNRIVPDFKFESIDEYYDENGNTVKRDFKPGDYFYVGVTGGATGMPLPGASVRFVVNSNQDNVEYTDEVLEDVSIVPNPYYISHQGQASPYDAKIYFTKLPPVCTVSIYTSSGQLISKLENNQNPATNDGVIEWDLLNGNGIRVQSQSLVAVVETPDGSSSVHNFSIVVGGFKIITDF